MTSTLDTALVERVLDRLGLSSRPEVSLAGLADLYGAWCRKVPFDNIRKLIHVRAGNPATLPGDTPNEFFEAWLAHGTGATCWAGNGALCELLTTLGFDARRAAATMMVAPGIPPNHGSVVVHFDDARYVTDASILFVDPVADSRRRSRATSGLGRRRAIRRRRIHDPLERAAAALIRSIVASISTVSAPPISAASTKRRARGARSIST